MYLEKWRLELARRLRRQRGSPEIKSPPAPAGVFLNPSDADFAAYRSAPLALKWHPAADQDPLNWQQRVRSKLRELLGMTSTVIPDSQPVTGIRPAPSNGIQRQTIYVPSAPRRHIPVTFVWATGQSDQRLPVMICLQGHTSGAHISWGEARAPIDVERIANGGDFALQAVCHGHVAICIEQIAFGERREQALTHRWEHTCIDASNRALLLGRTLLGDRVADVLSVIAWLGNSPRNLPAMDLSRIRIMGNSAGGETALFSAALEPAIEAVIASGCVGDWRKTSGTRQTCPDTVIPGVLAWMEYNDVLALCAPRPVLVVSGVDDHLYPFELASECAESARPVFAALNAADRIQTLAGPAGHRFYPELAWPRFMDMVKANQ